jgi:hypothetical protein
VESWIIDGVGVFGDVEILLNDASRIGEKGPVMMSVLIVTSRQ